MTSAELRTWDGCASGQAVQTLNLLLGVDEATGLAPATPSAA